MVEQPSPRSRSALRRSSTGRWSGWTCCARWGRPCTAETDPTAQYYHGRPYTVSREDGQFLLSVELPFATKDEIALSRHADEILIDVGSWRRNLVLPRALIDAPTLGAKFDDHVLKIRFAAPPRNSNGGGSRG